METIKAYLENMFAALPKTGEVLNLKANLLANMEDKYNELKASGKSENEAVGIVISEFGNIEELAGELGISLEKKDGEIEKVYVSEETADEFLVKNKKSSRMVAIGASLCILSPVALIGLAMASSEVNSFISQQNAVLIGLLSLFVLVAVAVGLFIGSGTYSNKFEYMKTSILSIDSSTAARVTKLRDQKSGRFTAMLITSICMYILSPVLLITGAVMTDENSGSHMLVCYGVMLLLIIVAIATFILISSSTEKEGYDILLGVDGYTPSDKKIAKKTNAIGGIYWPIVVIGYLAASFITMRWDLTWIIWPIAGVLFGIVSMIVNVATENKK